MRLWHDDVRPAPDGWKWARTNDEAKNYLKLGKEITEVSLDHDLGYDGPPPGDCEKCGGTGLIPFTDESISTGCAVSTHPCDACDGDGFIGGDVYYIAGTAEETGCDLVRWMIETNHVPPRITIHSWNPPGADEMAKLLRDAGHDPLVKRFEIPPKADPNKQETTEEFVRRAFGYV